MENESEYDDGNIVVIEGSDAIRCRASMYLGELEREDLFDELMKDLGMKLETVNISTSI